MIIHSPAALPIPVLIGRQSAHIAIIMKPMEMPISYFLDLAWDFDRWGTSHIESAEEYQKLWVGIIDELIIRCLRFFRQDLLIFLRIPNDLLGVL